MSVDLFTQEVTADPIGRLYLDAQARAEKNTKTRAHTATAECGCQVTVSMFSDGGHIYSPERCFRHPVKRQ